MYFIFSIINAELRKGFYFSKYIYIFDLKKYDLNIFDEPGGKSRLPNIELNHIWTVVDKPTYDAIKNSDFIKSFAYSYEQSNSADGQTGWQGFYIRGKHTFLEIFYPQERYKSTGLSGIGLGFDKQGSLKEFFMSSFRTQFSNAQLATFKRDDVPWFDYIAVDGSYFGEGHSFWVMEYSSNYFKDNNHDISREHYNASSFDADKPLVDITGFSLALNPIDQKTLISYLTGVGMHTTGKNEFTTDGGIRVKITDESETQKGIYNITFSLSKTIVPSHIVRLGNSEILLDINEVTWKFYRNEF